MRRASRTPILLTLTALGAVGCIIGKTVGRQQSLAVPVRVETPVKVHLTDGSIVVMRYGAAIGKDSIRGWGMRYAPGLRDSALAGAIGLDSVVGVESFERKVDEAATFGVSLLAIPLAKVAFGSCPTIYSDSAGVATLETESFSYSIAPLLAKRDVDRLRASPDANGVLRLEVRNEALETHYIDHLELLEVRHPAGWTSLPAAYGDPVVAEAFRRPYRARDRAGRNVLEKISFADTSIFSTDSARLASATDSDNEDWIELALPASVGSDSVALALRMRSSLLTTVLFYDYMLGRAGARSLDWMAQDLARITTMASIARWYTATLGLRVEVRDGDRWRQVARLVDFGPIAWREIGVVLPTMGADTARVRLRFLADEWRIDRVAYASRFERRKPRLIRVARVLDDRDRSATAAHSALLRPDASRVVTTPGSHFFVEFDAGINRSREERSYLIAAQGYYTEWMRADWIRNATDSLPFDARRVRVSEVLASWRQVKDSLEQAFFRQRVPIS